MRGRRFVALSELEIPVLVVHSDVDDLFPLAMAKRVAEACGPRGELIVVNGLSHNAPIFAPTAGLLAADCGVGEGEIFRGSCGEDCQWRVISLR